ncbi:MAG: acetylornithine transaminase [Nitrospirales bacterium]|nr:acetylornithine transaminase [Nitrospirales bacterium]
MENKRIIEEAENYIMHTYNRLPLVIRKGRGVRVWGADGKEYLDFVGGIAVNVLGHCHPKVVVAIQKQAQRLIHVSNLYHIEPQIKLAKLLCTHSFAEKVFFCNSGAEANEAAIKLARKYSREHFQNPARYEIITAHNSFHGRTMATITATGQRKFQEGFEPLLPGFSYVPFNDLKALEAAVTDRTCAILLEPIQGEGGVKVPSETYFRGVRDLCNKHNILLILDEVQTGMGRTGKLFAHEHFGITPDIMTLAKGLGGGVPIGAMLATDRVAAAFKPGNHASTFGGNPLVCAAAIATIEAILEDGLLLEHCNRMGRYFIEKLSQLREDDPAQIIDIRGKGLMVAMEINRDGTSLVKACLEKGALINCTAGNVLRFTPALTVEEKDIDQLVDILEEVMGR